MRLSLKALYIFTVLSLSFPIARFNTACAQTSPAERLIAAIPDDVLCYFVTNGGDRIKPAYEKSNLGRLFRDPAVTSFIEATKQPVLLKITQELDDPNKMKAVEIVRDFVGQVLSRPIIVGVAQKQTREGLPFYGFAILDAGTHKTEIESALGRLETLIGEENLIDVKVQSFAMHRLKSPNDVPVYWGWIGNHLVFTINNDIDLILKHLQGNRNRPMPTYLRKVQGPSDILAGHVDGQKIYSLIENFIREKASEEEFVSFKAFLHQFSLDNIKSFTFRMGFDGRDIVCDSLLEIPQPRTGMYANLKTIDLELLDMVDPSAMSVVALGYDIAGVYDTVMTAIKAAAGDDFKDVEDKIASVESDVEIKIRDGLLESFGNKMVFYTLPGPTTMQFSQGSFVVIARLKDAKLWEKTVTTLGEFLAEKSEGSLQIGSQTHGQNRIHSWVIAPMALMNVMPSWTVMDDKVIIASTPMLLTSTVDRVGSDQRSIRSTAGFKSFAGELPGNLVFLKYDDSKARFQRTMMGMQQVWPMITMMARQKGVTLPSLFPNLSHLSDELGPSYAYGWFDADGLHMRCRRAFIVPGLPSVSSTAFAMGILMPALVRVRQIAFRMVSGANLSEIGQAILDYSAEHNGELPPNLQEFAEEAGIPPKIMESRFKPDGFQGPSYIYIAGQNVSMDSSNILAYENPEFCSEGVNVLYLDFHVAWIKPEVFTRELKATYKRLGRVMPDIRFKNP